SSLRRFEPCSGVAAGKNVLLNAERRYIEAVDDILRGHDQLHVTADWNMQFVDLARTLGMLQLPHPLLRDYVNFGRIFGRRAFLEENHSTPGEDEKKNSQRDDGPCDLQDHGAFQLLRFPFLMPAIVQRKKNDGEKNRRGHNGREHDQENKQRV